MNTIPSLDEFLVQSQNISSTSCLRRTTPPMEEEGLELLMKMLPKEILTEILIKLPVKSLVRLSCVCKPWRAFIFGNPYFGNKHFNYWLHCKNHDDPSMLLLGCYCPGDDDHQENPYILTRDSYNNSLGFVPRPLDLPFYNHYEGTTLGGGSCNGILCLAIDGIVRLYNPITGQVVILPPGDVAYDEFLKLGFGFDVSTNDYKVIKICDVTRFKGDRKQLHNRYAVEIYKLSTNCWRKLDMDLNCEKDYISNVGVFVNGFYHWYMNKESTHQGNMILTFDFQEEIFGEIECPGPDLDMKNCLAVFDDSPVVFSRNVDCSDVYVWVMLEYGKKESWTKKFSIRDLSCELSCEIKCGEIHDLWIQDKTIILLSYDGEVMEISIEEGCTKEEARFRMLFQLDHHGVNGVVFRPTLVSLLRGKHDEQVVDLFQDFDFVSKENGDVEVENSTTVPAESELILGSSSASASHEFEEECRDAKIQEFPSELDQDIDEGWMEWECYYDNATQFDQNLDLQLDSNQRWEYLDPTQFIMNLDCTSFGKAGPVAMDAFHDHDEVQELPSAIVNDSEIEGWMNLL